MTHVEELGYTKTSTMGPEAHAVTALYWLHPITQM